MTPPDSIETVLKDSKYCLDLFSEDAVASLRKRVSIKNIKGKDLSLL